MPSRSTEPLALAEIVPPRVVEGGMAAARTMLAALIGETFALELLLSAGAARWYVRAPSARTLERILTQLHAVYPQAVAERADSRLIDLDPARVLVGERGVQRELLPALERSLPLHADWQEQRDPLAGLLGVRIEAGERVICRLTLGPAPRGAADAIRRRSERERRDRDGDGSAGPSALPLAGAFGLAALGFQGWRWYEAEEWVRLAGLAGGGLVGAPLLGTLALRVLRRADELAVPVVQQKLAASLLGASLEVVAIASERTDRRRLEALSLELAAAYSAFDDPSGGGLRPVRPHASRSWSPRGRSLLLNAAEAAALWHLPDLATAPEGVRRGTARRMPPVPGHATRGVRVGCSDGGGGLPVHAPARLLHRNHLLVAKTRRGKSTLLRHLAAGVMQRVASGADDTALVVVDPHQDLATAVLETVPDALADRTLYLNFANLEYPVGLNLLDVALFPDRDRTTEQIIVMLNRLWPANWGPRMEGALRASLAALLEANLQLPRDAQFTLLDVAPFLTDGKLRGEVLTRVQDPALVAWFRDNYDRAGRVLQQQTANPVTSKIGRFTVTEASRLVLGQAQSTFDPRAVIRDGGVLVVNTAVGALGEGAASLVGATLINLLALLIEEQVALPAARRRQVIGLIDESSTLGAVDYGRMLSELGKYGASFVLVTQSLSKLDAIDRNLAPTIFANSDGLTVFQVSAEDARLLTPELGPELEIEDLVSLDDFTCYARWWDGRSRPPAFSFRVDPPPPSEPSRAVAIAARSAARHGRPRAEVVAEIARTLTERSPEPEESQRQRRTKAEIAEGAQEGARPDTEEPESPAGPSPTARHDVPVDPQRPTKASGGSKQRTKKQKAQETHDTAVTP